MMGSSIAMACRLVAVGCSRGMARSSTLVRSLIVARSFQLGLLPDNGSFFRFGLLMEFGSFHSSVQIGRLGSFATPGFAHHLRLVLSFWHTHLPWLAKHHFI